MSQHLCRSGDHVIRDHRDRAANGGCRGCQQRRQRVFMAECRAARRRLREDLLSA